MKPVEKFAQYNRENILGNLLQAETHYKNLSDTSDPDYSACINKHLLEAQMELSELQAHDPKNMDTYKEMMLNIRKLRKDNIRGIDPSDGISRIRDVRGKFEGYVKGFNTEFCQSCGDFSERLVEYSKSLNRDGNHNSNIPIKEDKDWEDNMAKMAKDVIGKVLVGNLVGKGISVVTPMVVPINGIVPGVANKSLVNLLAGIGLTVAALYGKLGKMNLMGAVAGTNLIANEGVDLLMGTMTPAARFVSAAPMAAVNAGQISGRQLYQTTIGTTGGSNGALVYID